MSVADDLTIICICCLVIIICEVIKLIAAIGLFFTKKDRTEDKECKKDEEVA